MRPSGRGGGRYQPYGAAASSSAPAAPTHHTARGASAPVHMTGGAAAAPSGQVYAVIKQGVYIIITKKALINNAYVWTRWNPHKVVNQAGQWALPGGGYGGRWDPPGETAIQGAIRETQEETGIQLVLPATGAYTGNPSRPFCTSVSPHLEAQYTWVVFELDPRENIVAIVAQMRTNISIPPIQGSVHAENAEIRVINKIAAARHLGVRQPISSTDPLIPIAIANRQNSGSSQNIDWYTHIANELQHIP